MKRSLSLSKPLSAFVLIALSIALPSCSNYTVSVSDLTCEYLINSLGIDTETPHFSWKIENHQSTRGQKQTAYRLLVASSSDKLKNNVADVWDSGVVESEQSHLVPFGGGKLSSCGDYYWKVQVFDKDGKPSTFSCQARFSVGLLNVSDWQGEWLKHPTAMPERHIWFRKTLTVNGKPSTTFAYVASQGYHELYINGKKADERVLAPACSRNDRRVLYVTYDIEPLLEKGENTIALWYGPGWTRNNYFASRVNQAVLVQIDGKTKLGEQFELHSDTTWKCAESYSSNAGGFNFMDMGGEMVDGTQYNEDWNKSDFDDNEWLNAVSISPLKRESEIVLSAQMTDASYITKIVQAKSVSDTVPDVYRVDMGEHFTGYLNSKFYGLQYGDTVVITISEKVYATFNGKDMHASGIIGDNTVEDHRQKQIYIARGEDGETFRNRFNFFSGRYVHFTGLRKAPAIEDITGYAISSAPSRTATFECSDSLYNKIFEADLHTFEMCHTEGVIVDCPNRERLGYGPEGAYQTTWGLGLPCFESGAYYVKNVRDWADVQREDGFINNVAPQISIMYGCALNGTSNMNIAWEHFFKYGDKRILETVQPVGKRWLEFLNSYVKDGMLTRYAEHGYFLGDWVSPGPVFEYAETEEALYFNNCVYAMALDFYIDICKTIGKEESETAVYQGRLDTLRQRLHETYYRPKLGCYLNGDQVRTTCALYAGIVPDNLRQSVLQHLANDFQGEHPYINVGSFGRYPFYKTIIAENSFYEIFDNILSKTSYPGYGYFIANGCNVFPETWEIANSNCAQTHTSYLGISGWFIKGLAGIRLESQNCRVNIIPNVVEHLSFVRAESETPYGKVKSSWQKESDGTGYEINIPVGLSASITLPASAGQITETGKPLAESEGMTFVEVDGNTVITAVSGRYNFKIKQFVPVP
ncbi:MAG: glycoside hydrolase family 78 protein [Dysgonamonadaceae bacterium]|jgi:alpha-L-rhamnosidase|nr:glycoside hydrolase family 78 protein [Dysgonamonadaceae bacterium]